MRLLPKWLPTFILKFLKLFVTPKVICCSGERGTGERKRGYQAGFSEQVIDLFVLKLNIFNSYIHFCNILQFDLYIYNLIASFCSLQKMCDQRVLSYTYIISISICSLPLLNLKLPHKPSSGTNQVAGKSVNV